MVVPPTLVMMDDWEPLWRGRGVTVLKGWIERLPVETMKRMGMDKLLLNSLIHTLSLHANPPLKHVLPVTLKLVERCTKGAERADRYAEIMDKAVVQGWTYAPSGIEGRVVLVNIAEMVETLCSVLGTGMARWLKVCNTSSSAGLKLIRSRRSYPTYFSLCNFPQLRQYCHITAPTSRLCFA